MKKGYWYIFFSTILFSTMEIALKLVTNDFHPIQLTLLRFLIGGLILFPLAFQNLKTRGVSLNAADFRYFAITGLICVVISMTFYQLAVLYSKASTVAILFSCNPAFVIPFAYLLLGEKISKKTLLSLGLSILGILWIVNPWKLANTSRGVIFTLLSAVTFALYGVLGKAGSSRLGGVALSSFSFLMGSAEMLILILLTRLPRIAAYLSHFGLKLFAAVPVFSGLSWHNMIGLIYIGIFVTGLGYCFYFLAMQETSAATASSVFFIKPALAPVLALIILHESLAPNTIIGMVLIIAGSGITFIANRKREAAG